MSPTEQPKKPSRIAFRGFGSMNKEKHKTVASKGGKKISANREHMAAIGKMGGETSAARRRKQKGDENSNQITPQS